MKKKYLNLILLLLIPMALTACTKTQPQGQSTGSGQETTTGKDQNSFSGNMLGLLGLNKNLKCTFSKETDDMTIEGTSYIAGKRVRSDSKMTLTTDGGPQTFETYTIVDNNVVYNWGTMTDNGMKMDLDKYKDQAETPQGQPNQAQEMMAAQEDFDFKCTPWVVNNSVFQVPQNINFIDMAEMMNAVEDTVEAMGEGMGKMKDAACQACNAYSDTQAKQECLASLGCN